MPSILALVLALGFAAIAIRRDLRVSEGVSAAVWIPTLWMMRCASRNLDSWIVGGVRESNAFDQLTLSLLFVLGLLVLARRGNAGRVLSGNAPLLVLIGYIVLSIAWSPVPVDSGKRAFRASGDLLMAFLLATEGRPITAIMAAVRRTALVLVPLSLVLAKYFPSLGRAQEKHWAADSWIGVATHKNTLGQLCFVAVVVLGLHVLITAKRRRLSLMAIPFAMPTEVICLSASVYLLFGMGGSTYSSTSVLATLTALAMLRVASAFRHTPRLLPGFLVASLFGLLLLAAASEVLVGESLQSTVAALQGKDATLAGRTDLWQEVWRRASQHPLFGSGYGGFWTPEVVAEFAAMPRFSWDPQQSHNGYLETFAQLGSIGVVLLLWVIWHGLSGLARTMAADFRHGQLALSLLVAVLALNYAEAAFPRQNHLIWFVCLVVCSLPANSGGRVQGGGPSAPSREPKPGRKDERPAAKRAQVDPARDRRDVRSVDLGPWGF